MQITIIDALEKLDHSQKPFAELFSHGTLSVEVYQPEKKDHQPPHDKDEIYIIISGSGDFYLDGKISKFQQGDFL